MRAAVWTPVDAGREAGSALGGPGRLRQHEAGGPRARTTRDGAAPASGHSARPAAQGDRQLRTERSGPQVGIAGFGSSGAP